MCDYSLHHVASRPAKVGDKLLSTRFNRSGTGGFAAIGEPNVAVCLLPGTEVAFETDVEYEHAFRPLVPSLRFGFVEQRLARFRQINRDKPLIVLVTWLRPGQRATVLQLPACPRAVNNELEYQKSEPLVV
jgi:hypothetical protein